MKTTTYSPYGVLSKLFCAWEIRKWQKRYVSVSSSFVKLPKKCFLFSLFLWIWTVEKNKSVVHKTLWMSKKFYMANSYMTLGFENDVILKINELCKDSRKLKEILD